MKKTILVTGGSGFIGSNFIYYWINKYPKDKVVVLDSLNYAANINSIRFLINEKNINFFHGNINDKDLIKNILEEEKISHIINFAAETHVDRSINSPSVFLDSNVMGTYNLLECFRKHWEKKQKPPEFRFMHISTDEVFGSLNSNDQPFNENSPYKPNSPYSASKASSDHFVRAWHETYGLPVIISNCSNNYGPFQFPEKLIPLAITNILFGKKIPVYGDGENIRDWLYVEDHCSAIDSIISKANPGSTFCVGGNNELKNIDLIRKICKLVDNNESKSNFNVKQTNSESLITFVTDRPGHDKRYAINSDKLYKELNWEPHIDFDSGLKKTVDWYIKNKSWWEPILKNM